MADYASLIRPTRYTGKPRPVVIVQDDRFDATRSITICAFTSDPTEAPLFRLPVRPTSKNGLQTASHLMADKITTIRKDSLHSRVGQLDAQDMTRLNRAITVFLGSATA